MRGTFVILGAITVALFALIHPGTASAVCVPTIYSVTSMAPPPSANWTDTSGNLWQPSGGYPGCAPGDTAADTNATPTTINVDSAIPNPIIGLNLACHGCLIDFQSGGALALAGSGSIDSSGSSLRLSGGSLTIANGGTLTFQSGSPAFPLISGTVDVQSGGAISGVTTTGSGALLTADGVVQFQSSSSAGSLAGGGTVSMPSSGALTVGGDNTSTTFSGVYQASGGGSPSLTKTGTGTLTMSGLNTYGGPTTVNGGTLSVTGSTDGSVVTVNSGATLDGTGTVGILNVSSGGTVAPGTSVGTLRSGPATLSSGSTLAIELSGGGADQLDTFPTVDLGGAALDVSLLGGYVHTAGTVYTIVANDGGGAVTGTFSGRPEGATFSVGGHLFQISYVGGDGNDVTLTALAASPGLSTSASVGVVVGGSVHDTATISGGDSPGGTITFKLYGPNDSTCSGAPAFTSSAVAVSGNGSYDSGTFTPATAGTYRWRAFYSGDTNNNPVSTACNDANETVVVSAASPSISTNASDGIALGSGTVHDTATISGGFSPQGTITFAAFGPGNAGCSGSPAFTSVVSVSSGNGSYHSTDFTPTSAGTYRWIATYNGDGNNNAATTACNDANETVTVSKASPTLSTNASAGIVVGGSVHDTGTIAGGSSPGGTITFKLYGPNDVSCSGAPAFTSAAVPVAGNGSYDSGSFAPAVAGTYRWTAAYSGDGNNNAASSTCNAVNESVSVAATLPTLTTSASTDVTIGGSVHDTATLSGGLNPTGTIAYALYGPNDALCSGSPVFTATIPVSGNGDYGSTAFTPAVAGTYRWTASYSGDVNNNPASSPCNAGSESVVVSKQGAIILTTSASPDVQLGGKVWDTGTLSGGFAPSGQITFILYGPDNANCTQAPTFITSVNVSGNKTYTSVAFALAQPGVYRWTAQYSGDANNDKAFSLCNAANESVTVSAPPPPPPPPPPPVVRCIVPNVRGDKLADAEHAIASRHCSTGKISRAFSKKVKAGRVISQHPDPGTILRRGGAVDLVVSRGRKKQPRPR